MNVVDSSAWLEYFANGSNASFFAGPIEAIDEKLCMFLRRRSTRYSNVCSNSATRAMRCAPLPSCNKARSVDLDVRLALSAARLSLETRLPMADSVVFATARLHQATLWTQDADFASLPGVRYRARKT